jgi:hypothetical protein
MPNANSPLDTTDEPDYSETCLRCEHPLWLDVLTADGKDSTKVFDGVLDSGLCSWCYQTTSHDG